MVHGCAVGIRRDAVVRESQRYPAVGEATVCDLEDLLHLIAMLPDFVLVEHVAPEADIRGKHDCASTPRVASHSWGYDAGGGLLHERALAPRIVRLHQYSCAASSFRTSTWSHQWVAQACENVNACDGSVKLRTGKRKF